MHDVTRKELSWKHSKEESVMQIEVMSKLHLINWLTNTNQLHLKHPNSNSISWPSSPDSQNIRKHWWSNNLPNHMTWQSKHLHEIFWSSNIVSELGIGCFASIINPSKLGRLWVAWNFHWRLPAMVVCVKYHKVLTGTLTLSHDASSCPVYLPLHCRSRFAKEAGLL